MMLVLGVDAGGTASRAVLSTTDGTVVGRGAAGPGNPTTSGPQAITSIGTAISTALGDHPPAAVRSGVVGVAGVGVLANPAIAKAFADEWAARGLTCPITVVGDAVTAFAAATSAPSGVVLIAGTGAVAARIHDWQIGRTADGLGWLLGDEGSGLWLGLQAVRATARNWPSPTSVTGAASARGDLSAGVAAHAGAATCDELVHWAGRQPPNAFAALAPLVCAAATAGDPLAEALVAEAAAHLVRTLDELGPPDGSIALAGGLLTAETPVRAAVLEALNTRDDTVATSRCPAAGAAWLAIRQVTTPAEAQHLHSRMLQRASGLAA